MRKQIFTIILLLMGGVTAFGQFKLDGGVSSLRLQTGGIDRLYITPGTGVTAGNVGIGTITSTPPAKLTVVGDMALQKIQRETGSGGYNDYDRQDASIAIFENGGTIGGIQGGSRGQMLYVLCGYGNNQSALTIRHDSPLNPTAANRILTHTGADFVISGGAGGVLLIYDDTKARWRIVETPSGSGTAGWGLTGNSGTNPTTQFIGTTDAQPLAFKTNNTERMRILSDGKVGIGTNVPDRKLHVYNGNSGRTPYSFTSLFTESSSHNYLEIASPDASERGIIFSSTTDGTGGSGGIYYENKAMNFRTNTNDTQMKILANGNVGIGTTIPTAKLETNGTFALSKREINNPSGATGYIDNTNSVYKLSGGGTYNITGIEAGADGQVIYLYALSSTNIVLEHNSVTAPAKSIITNTGANVTISNGGGATLIYDADSGYWRVIGVAN